MPEGYEWVWQNNALYQKDTHFRLDESGWLINPRTKGYHDAYTGWRYDAANECLVDDETGKQYTMDREEIVFVAGVRCYPGQAAPYEVPANLTWNAEAGYATLGELPYVYDPNSGWLMDPETLRLPRRQLRLSLRRCAAATCSTRQRASATTCRTPPSKNKRRVGRKDR